MLRVIVKELIKHREILNGDLNVYVLQAPVFPRPNTIFAPELILVSKTLILY